MFLLEALIVSDHFFQCNWLKTVNINAGIQHLIPAGEQRPVVHIYIVVNMTVHHIATSADSGPGHHGIVAHNYGMTAVTDIQQWGYAFKMFLQVHLFHPKLVVISDNQMLLPI